MNDSHHPPFAFRPSCHGRRRFLIGGLGALAVPLISGTPHIRAALPNPGSGERVTGLATYRSGNQVWVREGNEVVATYRAHPDVKYPYLYPLAGPVSGRSVVAETNTPWPHHRGVFFACDRVNGIDFWHADTAPGRILSDGPKVIERGDQGVVIGDTCRWTAADGRVLMSDRRRLTIQATPGQHVVVDWQIDWKAEIDVSIPRNNHSLFAVRAAPDIAPTGGGNLVNAEGDEGEAGTYGKPSAWCAFYGPRGGRDGGRIVEGLCLMDHPANRWPGAAPWFTRDYGFATASPMNFLERPFQLASGEEIQLRYRVVAFGGTPDEAGLAGLYAGFVE